MTQANPLALARNSKLKKFKARTNSPFVGMAFSIDIYGAKKGISYKQNVSVSTNGLGQVRFGQFDCFAALQFHCFTPFVGKPLPLF